MSFINLQPALNVPFTNNSRVWRVTITAVPEQTFVKFIGNGPNLYGEPVAWVKLTVFSDSQIILFPWVPIQQETVDVCQPVIKTQRGGDAELVLEPGATGTIVSLITP